MKVALRYPWLASLLIIFRMIPAAWAAEAAKSVPGSLLNVENACTALEKWSPENNNFAKYLQARIPHKKGEQGSETSQAQILLRALALKAAPKSKTPNPLGDAINAYWVAHAMYDLGLVFQAQHLFNEIIASMDNDKASPIWIASLSCLGRIHESFPTLGLEPKSQKIIEEKIRKGKINDEQKLLLYRSIFWTFKRENREKELKRLATVFQGEPFFLKLSVALREARAGKSIEVLRQAQALNSPLFKLLSAREREAWRLLYGMALFDVKQYDPAVSLLSKIPNTSNDFIQALVVMSWSNLWQNKYEEAIGNSSNLILGALSKSFAPDGFETLSIALLETCNYNALLETLQHFRKVYEGPHKFLEELAAKKGALDLYPLVSSFLIGGSKIPDRVGTQWISDPVFLANQAEINLQIDELALVQRLRKLVPTLTLDPKLKPQRDAWTVADKNLTLDLAKFPERKVLLTQEIQSSLRQRMEEMRSSLSRVVDNLQLLEAEAYEAIGDHLIAQTGPAAAEQKTTPKAKRTKGNEAATWDWGVYKGGTGESSSEQGEIWYDELGYLKADLKKTCD